MKITDIIKKMALKEQMTATEKRYNESVTNNYPNINTQGAYNIEFRDLIRGVESQKSVAKVSDKYGANDIADPFISRITTYENLVYDCACPYVTPDGIEWKENGFSAEGQQTAPTAEKLRPHRLTTQIGISREVLFSNTEIESQLTDAIVRAMYSKMVESMLSTFSGSTDQPQGIFNGVSANTISSVDNLIDLQARGDANKTQNVWLISPMAKKHLNKFDINLLRSVEMLNSEAVCDNRMESPYVAYMPLNLAVLGVFGPVSITVDNVTQLVNGRVIVTIDFYVDFGV